MGIRWGLTESQMTLALILLTESLTNGQFSQISIRSLGALLMPSITEDVVKTQIQNILTNSDENELKSLITVIGDSKFSFFVVYITVLPVFLSLIGNFVNVIRASKHSVLHILEGFLPLVLCGVYF